MRYRLFSLLVLLILSNGSGMSQRASKNVNEEKRAHIWGRTTRPVVRGRHYAISSMMPSASLAAERILRAGGNAFDAAVAGQAMLSVVDAASNGVGGDAMILVYDADSEQVFSVNATGTAPKLATIEWYQKNNDGKIPISDTLLSGTIPATVDAWYVLLDRWGTMSFSEVLAPAIEFADKGFPISDKLARGIAGSSKLPKYPSSLKVYKPGGRAPQPGEIFRNPDLARTLKKLVAAEEKSASQGRRAALRAARDRFYKGDIARTMARFSEENGGLFRYQDFADYRAKVEKPVSVNYRGYQIYKNPSNNQGPAELLVLNLLEGFDLEAMGQNSPEYIHTCIEAIKLAFADRDKYIGDMDFIDIPYEGLLSKDYARERRKLIDPRRASLEFRPGVAEHFMRGVKPVDRPQDVDFADEGEHEGDTSYIAVVDRNRNVVSFTPSLHSGFGTKVVIEGLGFSMNCRGDYYSLMPGHANALVPGKRPRSTLNSTLVMKDGKPAMALGSPGGDDQIQRILQTFLNMVEFGANVQQAIEAPRWSTRSFPSSIFPHTMYPGDLRVEERMPEKVRKALQTKGHRLEVRRPWSMGSNAAIVIDWESGVLHAGADPRVDAYALAW